MSSAGYRLSRLDNGVRVVSIGMPHLVTASVGLWVDVGARYETPEANGIAHLMEHMAFKGTARRSAQRIAEEIEAVGGILNAYTSREHTAYYARILAADLPLAVDLLADIIRHPRIDDVELERERTVVLQEIGQVLDTPDDWVFDLWQQRAYPDQALGRSILGPAETVAKLGRDDLVAYLESHYAPDRVVVAAAGNVDHDQLAALACDRLGDWRATPKPAMPPAAYGGGVCLDDADHEQVHVVLGIEGVTYTDPDFYTSQVLTTALGGGMSSRLFQEIRERRGLAYSVFAFGGSYVDTGLIGMYAAQNATHAAQVVRLLEAGLRDLVAAPIEEEIARARAQLKASLLMSLESCAAVCEDVARQELIFGDYLAPAHVAGRIDEVDAARIRTLGERLLNRPAATFAALGPLPADLERVAATALAA